MAKRKKIEAPKHKKIWFLAVCLETLGAMIGVAGICIEVSYEAHMGFVCITGGSVLFALGSLVYAKFTGGGSAR